MEYNEIKMIITMMTMTTISSLWDVVAPWLRRWLSTGGSWVWLPL